MNVQCVSKILILLAIKYLSNYTVYAKLNRIDVKQNTI